jgi:hypothetical protein
LAAGEDKKGEGEHEREKARELVPDDDEPTISSWRVKAERALQSVGLETVKPLDR